MSAAMSFVRVWTGVAVGCLLLLGTGACNSASTEDLCNKQCICESCSAVEQSQCTSDRDEDRVLYESNDCDYDAFLDCAVDTATCVETGISFATTCQDKLLASCDTVPEQS